MPVFANWQKRLHGIGLTCLAHGAGMDATVVPIGVGWEDGRVSAVPGGGRWCPDEGDLKAERAWYTVAQRRDRAAWCGAQRGGKMRRSNRIRLSASAPLAVVLAVALLPFAGLAPLGVDAAAVRLVPVVAGFERPLYVTGAGDGSGRLFVVEQPGRIRVVMKDGRVLATPFLDLTRVVNDDANERGLLGLAFHPDYERNGLLFVHYTDARGDVVVARYAVSDDPDRADPASARPVLRIRHRQAPNHNGGMLAFGPRDGYLYVAVGDGGGGQSANGQNTRTLLGKILRVDVDRASGARNYAIPAGNPFADGEGGRPEIWAYGLRNPFRFSFDRETAGLYVGDVGEGNWEEIDYGAPGRGGLNYGWDTTEGRHCYDPPSGCDRTGIAFPIHAYSHEVGNVVTGGYVYRGRAIAGLAGTYVFTDFGSRELWGLKRNRDGRWTRSVLLRSDDELRIASFGENDRGELFAVDLVAGALYRLAPA